jgi:hypothetical protein
MRLYWGTGARHSQTKTQKKHPRRNDVANGGALKGEVYALSFKNYFSGASRNAGFTACALCVVNYGQVVYHCNCARRALFSAHTAGDTTGFAGVHNVLTLAL